LENDGICFRDDDDDDNNDDYFWMKNERMMFEILKNTMMKYEMMKMMFDLDFYDVVMGIRKKKLKRNILIDLDENEERLIDDDDDIEMMSIDNDGDDDDEHNEYQDNRNDDDGGSNNHFVDRNVMVNYDDRVDDNRKKIFFDVDHWSME
jgi:hypothetical protein